MINKTKFKFKDISTEEYRIYDFGDNIVRIDEPTHLSVSDSGGHRIFDAYGVSHYVPTGWLHLKWKAKKGEANFVA
jgi:hypothetical protein